MLASSYPLADVLWTMLAFFLGLIWLVLLVVAWSDLFRRHDIAGWGKAAWLVATILLPFAGVFVYLIAEGQGMQERADARREQSDNSGPLVAEQVDPVAQVERAQALHQSGAISEPEFDALKRKILA
jgi:hypothetical protein